MRPLTLIGGIVPFLALGLPLAAQGAFTPFAIVADQSRTAISIQGAGARAVGLGGAFIGLSDDATAISFNPAGLAQLVAPEFSLVAENLQREQAFTRFKSPDQDFDDSSLKDTAFHPLFFSATFPVQMSGRNLAITVAYQRIVDFDFNSDRNLTFRGATPGSARRLTNSIDQNGAINLYSVGLGMEVTPRILVGASFSLWRGAWSFDSSQTIQETGANFDIIQDSKFRGVNLNAGILWRSRNLNVGLAYRAGFQAEYTFSNRYTSRDDQGRLQVQPAQDGLMDLQWPDTIGLGLAWKPADRLTVVYDQSKTRWSGAVFRGSFTTHDATNGDIQDLSLDGANFFDFLRASKTADSTDRRGGVEWIAFLGDSLIIPLRAGLFREPQPGVDRTTNQQRVFTGYTLGFGLKWRSATFDFAYKDAKADLDISKVVLLGGTNQVTALGHENLREKRFYVTGIFQLHSDRVRQGLRSFFVGR